jgi:hypothetical protein
LGDSGSLSGDPGSLSQPDSGSPPSCGSSSVTFELLPDPDGGVLWTGSSEDTDSPSENWITLFTEDGGAEIDMVPASSTPGIGIDCTTCSGAAYAIPIGYFLGQMGDAGVSQTWDGRTYTRGTCGGSTACVTQGCAAPGRYEAHFCACPSAEVTGTNCAATTCTSVVFEYPSSTPVAATL